MGKPLNPYHLRDIKDRAWRAASGDALAFLAQASAAKYPDVVNLGDFHTEVVETVSAVMEAHRRGESAIAAAASVGPDHLALLKDLNDAAPIIHKGWPVLRRNLRVARAEVALWAAMCQGNAAAVGYAAFALFEARVDAVEWTPPARPWPKLPDATLRGFAGRFIRLATKNSEADPAAVLATFLCRFGAEVAGYAPGCGPYVSVCESRHYPRLFVAVVGDSAKARKGTSAGPVRALFSIIEGTDYSPAATSPGPLSSGEGLIWAVRDEIQEWQVDKKTGEGRYVTTDPGVTDKRLFILDEELAAAIQAGERKGNTNSATMRCLWDSGDAAPLTKTSRTATTGAHVCVVTHVTKHELQSLLGNVQAFNGWANRFLWVCARRSKHVPFPEPMDPSALSFLRVELLDLLRTARERGHMKLDDEARGLWAEAYPELSAAHPGLTGAIVARAEAQTLRLALIYALLDGAGTIGADHLHAALAFWGYCHASAMHIFGDRGADPMSEKVLAALKAGPKTTTEIHHALGGRADREALHSTLRELVNCGAVQALTERTKGRSRTVFALTSCEFDERSEESPVEPELNSSTSSNSQGSQEKRGPVEAWI